MSDLEINNPGANADVVAAVKRYEGALVGNDVEALDRAFWDSPHTVRFGAGENLYGRDEILTFRKARSSKALARSVNRLVVTTFGNDFATASLEFVRKGEPRVGRQSQTWVRFPEGWRVVGAHVSWMDQTPPNDLGHV